MCYLGALVVVLLGLADNLISVETSNRTNNRTLGPRVKLEISPAFVISSEHKRIFSKCNETMNLTCTAVYQGAESDDNLHAYDVDWKVPPHVKTNSFSGAQRGQSRNAAWLWFDRLTENDNGEYVCAAVALRPEGQHFTTTTINLFVMNKPTFCGERWFRCRSTHCIMERYLCDGKADCDEGEDESVEAGCGPNPCNGKIPCEDRCIPPEWCCDHRNCSKTVGLNPWPSPNYEINYVQTAFYTVIGCAIAFMFIVTVLVIAICRVHIKRAMQPRQWTQADRNNYNRGRTVLPGSQIYDFDLYLNPAPDDHTRSISIMYNNNNNGVQFFDRAVEPPPYSEAIAALPQEGSPPPYISCESLTQHSTSFSRPQGFPDVRQLEGSSAKTSNYPVVQTPMEQLRPINASKTEVSRIVLRPQNSTSSYSTPTNMNDSSLRTCVNIFATTASPASQNLDSDYIETDALLSKNVPSKIT